MPKPTSLIVCPTSHMDWNWIYSFDEYYKVATFGRSGEGNVQSILDAAATLPASQPTFHYSLAELAWLQRYVLDQGSEQTNTKALAGVLTLMGGAITSPDNIVCDGEVYVRAYLVGRQWARAAGLGATIDNVSWMPDDFGHDPELPVILTAMGLTAVGVARVPGAFPNYNTQLPPGSGSMACELMTSGVAFNWQAGDGSSIFAHFMPDQYGVPFWSAGDDGSGNATTWKHFVHSLYTSSYFNCSHIGEVVWPGGVAFAPAGGDFSVPDAGWVNGVADFNGDDIGTTASIGTFADYVAAVRNSGATLATTPLDPSNFWTGYFGSRPALKILQARASRDLVAAETISRLLWLGSAISSATLQAIDGAIEQAWRTLAPSSHHDFITGTSPDRVYKMEQYPMLATAATMAAAVRARALQTVADTVSLAGPGNVVVVHNAVGLARAGIVELRSGSAVTFNGSAATVQPLDGGRLLAQTPVVPSLGYVAGLVQDDAHLIPHPHHRHSDTLTMNNGTIGITITAAAAWGITAISADGSTNVLPTNTVANQIVYYNDSGNLYQYGNEPGAGGTFSPGGTTFTAGDAVQTEFGPLRWRAEATLTADDGTTFTLGYTLHAGEALVRMDVTGSAPAATTVVTTFPAVAVDGTTQGTHLVYGTAHHYHDDQAPAYWTAPTFKATHNFLMPAADTAGAVFALAAIYHNGMPAWACTGGQILGSLFRNTDGTQRGAAGTDSDTHTQHYALRISDTALDPSQGQPLAEALQYSDPLQAAVATDTNKPESPITLPATQSLASTQAPALVMVARPMGNVPSGNGNQINSQVAIRVYRPDANGTQTTAQVTMPVLESASQLSASLITALEDPIPNAPTIGINNGVFSVPAAYAVTTMAVAATRPITEETNGE